VDVRALAARLAEHREVPAKVLTEAAYLASQTEMLATVLGFLGAFLGGVMGLAAVFTATTTMLAALASRTNEIGVLLALGYRPVSIFLSFLFESLVIGLAGGLVGCLIAWPLDGLRTGTTNFQTFTEVGFAFQLTPTVLATAVAFALALGLLGGAWPAWRAARLTPTEALRRR
jgi:putative ABC transport system permease protein